MYSVFVVCMLCLSYSTGDTNNANQFCAELNPQPHVDIEQLMGMWYAVEIISHRREDLQSMTIHKATCPVLYLSEDKTTTTMSPLHKNYNYGEMYGTGYGTTLPDAFGNVEINTETPTDTVYDTARNNENYREHRPRYGTVHRQRKPRIKRLLIMWNENGNSVEYFVHYISKASVWYSSGPENGSSLAYPYNGFAGTIQVIKAVGNHLVLTFCHRLPDEKLYTVLLSRMPHLRKVEINGVHNLLTRRGLETINVRKVCEYSSSINYYPNIIFTFIIFLSVFNLS